MGKIKTPGKFEGEQDYAPYFYDAMLESGQDEDVEVDGETVAIFTVTDEDREKFPALKSRERVAFYESNDGFWTEVDVPETGDDEDGGGGNGGPPDDEQLYQSFVISDKRGGGYTLKLADSRKTKSFGADGFDDALKHVRRVMDDDETGSDIYYVNERGNIDLIDVEGTILKSWV